MLNESFKILSHGTTTKFFIEKNKTKTFHYLKHEMNLDMMIDVVAQNEWKIVNYSERQRPCGFEVTYLFEHHIIRTIYGIKRQCLASRENGSNVKLAFAFRRFICMIVGVRLWRPCSSTCKVLTQTRTVIHVILQKA